MRTVLDHPLRTLAGLLVLAFCLFVLSASGQPDTFWKSGPSWLGTIGWFGFLLTALVFVVLAVVAGIRAVSHGGRRTA